MPRVSFKSSGSLCGSGSQLGVITHPRRRLVMSGDNFGWHGLGRGAAGIGRAEARCTVPHPTCTAWLLTVHEYPAPSSNSEELRKPTLYLRVPTYSITS